MSWILGRYSQDKLPFLRVCNLKFKLTDHRKLQFHTSAHCVIYAWQERLPVLAQGSSWQLSGACMDLKGAYDKVQRPLLWQALQKLGLHGRMLAAIQSLYESSTL